MRELKLWRFILEHLRQDEPVILMVVVESNGSSPGRQGFKMVVSENEMYGSIGGGIMEHKFVEMAKDQLLGNENYSMLRKQFHQKSAAKDQSGMICSGEQTILLYPVSENDISDIEKIILTLESSNRGELNISSSGIKFSDNINPEKDFHFEMKSETVFEYTEDVGYKNHLFIVGGGHCALALSKLMSGLDFYIHLFEDRENLNTMVENTFVHEKKIVSDYSELTELIPSGENHFVAVMTFSYRTDNVAVRSLINKDFKYFGVLGSESKMKQLFEEWKRGGIPEETLKKIRSPIGIQIKSETPEEIGVSIAAEIIKVKNSRDYFLAGSP